MGRFSTRTLVAASICPRLPSCHEEDHPVNPVLKTKPSLEYIRLGLGIVCCLAFAFVKGMEPQAATWIEILLLISVLLLMPLAESLHGNKTWSATRRLGELIAGLMLFQSLLSPISHWTGMMGALVWLLVRLQDASVTLCEGWNLRSWQPAFLCQLSSRLFPAIGAAWLLAYRANYMPFGFDALIVLLTAAHFHHAGFTLPLMAGLCGKAQPSALTRHSCLLILAGVPLVATGITCTHFKVLPWVEPLSVSVLVTGALGIAISQMRMAFHPDLRSITKILFVISSLSLFVAMLLALSFGFRSSLPQWALPMPHMWTIHGTLNTFGFGLCGLLAWRQYYGAFEITVTE